MQTGPSADSKINVAVVGVGYWGKNLVRNFYELGALSALCDDRGAVEASCRQQYESVRFCRDYRDVLAEFAAYCRPGEG